ncbi:MAG: cyclic pyranopterin phosphate synthase MoaA, partial [Nitrospirota bacterium]|nr:cyclic pyranopterin phosphate synthase MoaA [Nitrospirota bacterium]
LTADGVWYLCLYAKEGMDLREPLRSGLSRDELLALVRSRWEARKDRGAEERKDLEQAGLREARLIEIQKLREDPHLEMHARGG